MRTPGKCALFLGPSGSGKSHVVLTALKHHGSGVVVLAQGLDEIESYSELYDDADILATEEDARDLIEEDDDGKARLVTEKPYLFAAFNDDDFFPTVGDWKATGAESLITFLKLLRQKIRQDLEESGELPYRVLGLDSYSGVGELANNAMLSALRFEHPPKARGEGGAEYYIGYKNKLNEVGRACRSIRGFGVDWLATCHVQMKEASDTYGAKDVQAKEQQMPMFTGQFREQIPSFFDIVFYNGIGKSGDYYAQVKADAFRNSKSRYRLDGECLDAKGRIENDWPKIEAAIST